MSRDPGTLAATEPHPAARDALRWLAGLDFAELCKWQEGFASTALEGNRLAEVCSETLRRVMDPDLMVSDRYLLGLAWTMRYGGGEVEA